MKICSTCRQEKSLDEFHRDRNAGDGRARLCKSCACAKAAAWVASNPERHLENRRRFGRLNRDEVNRQARERYANNPLPMRVAKIRFRYGLTPEAYESMRIAQGDACAICGIDVEPDRFHIDHDHVTGAVRGLLCRLCNQGIGFFRDDPAALRLAVEYLERTTETAR